MIDFNTRMAQLLEAGFFIINCYEDGTHLLESPDGSKVSLDSYGRCFLVEQHD